MQILEKINYIIEFFEALFEDATVLAILASLSKTVFKCFFFCFFLLTTILHERFF